MSRPSRKSHHSATPPPRFRYARQVFLAVSALVVVAVAVVGHEVILPFLFAAVVGYVLFPAVCAVERMHVPRWLAILLVYAAVLGSLVGFGAGVMPRIIQELKGLTSELPKLTDQIRDDILPVVDESLSQWTSNPKPPKPVERKPPIVVHKRADGSYAIDLDRDLRIQPAGDGSYVIGPPHRKEDFSSERVLRATFDKAVSWARRNGMALLAVGRAIVGGISRGIFYFFITLMLAGYMMYTWERILGFIRGMWPRYRRAAFDKFVVRLDRGLAGVVRGQLIICLVNGVLAAVGFWIFGLKYWPIMALISGVMSIIPIFGSILSTIPAVAIGLTQGLGVALSVLLWVIAVHQLEANFLNPKIIGDAAKIHPVLVVFALLFGEHFFQITGALLAVPALAIVQAVFLHFHEELLGFDPRDKRPAPVPKVPVPAIAGAGIDPGDEGLSVAFSEGTVTQGEQGEATRAEQPRAAQVPAVDAGPSDEVETQLVRTKRSHSEAPDRPTDPDPPEADADADPEAQRKLRTTLKSHTK